mgnify:CR=1 FL=1
MSRLAPLSPSLLLSALALLGCTQPGPGSARAQPQHAAPPSAATHGAELARGALDRLGARVQLLELLRDQRVAQRGHLRRGAAAGGVHGGGGGVGLG